MSMTQQIEDKPLVSIRPPRKWELVNIREVWQFRDLIMTLAQRDILLRYRQTALGIIWVILIPLMSAGIFAFVFGKVAKMSSGGVPYFLFAFAGTSAWNVFSSIMNLSSNSLVSNSQLISKIYFPRLALPISTVLGALLDYGVAMIMMSVMLVIYHVPLHLALLLLPLWLIATLFIALGSGLIAGALMVSYRDVRRVMPVFLNLLMYASPVAYSIANLSPKLKFIYMLNPLSSLLQGFRWSLLGQGAPSLLQALYACIGAVVVLIIGMITFRSMEKGFADVI